MGSGGSLPSFAARRILLIIPLLLVISLGVFSLVLLLPGNPAVALAGGIHSTPQEVAVVERQLHLNEGFWSQYWLWLKGVLHGNLGSSLFQNQTVANGIAGRFPITFSLALGGTIVAILIGIPAGILSGVRQGTAEDRLVTLGSSLGVAIPDFWLAMILVIVFAVHLQLLPVLGFVPFSTSPGEWFLHLILPWLALGIGGSAIIARQVRGELINTLDQDYIRTARAKGIQSRSVIGKHALKNALSPAVTVIGIQFGYLLGGTFIIEQIFSLPGIGTYTLQAIAAKDLPVIQGVVLVTATSFVVVNLLVDLTYGLLNPKVRLG
jgi:peptide/nickel transport system permease protein